MMIRVSTVSFFCLLLAGCSTMQRTPETGFLNRAATAGSTTIPYVVYVPLEFQQLRAGQRLPVVLFLHGAGERGDDGLRQTAIGLGSAVRWSRGRFPAIVVFPQAPSDTRWDGEVGDAAMIALDRTIEEFSGDRQRVYLTGLSLGGYGTWHFGMAYPGRFAALVPVCGGILKPETAVNVRQSPLTIDAPDPYALTAERVRGVPIWIFHGADDPIIPVSESRRMHEQLEKLGAEVRYTEYSGVGHDAWDRAYGEEALWTWLFAR